jgi:4-diphosphocytidyl-2-C-methyl-D-erythritol kinase
MLARRSPATAAEQGPLVSKRTRAPLTEAAPAKVNLTLAVLGRRADGYHLLDSLVTFARFGDRLTLMPGAALSLTVRGTTAAATGAPGDNLVLNAARALAEEVSGLRLGRFTLDKRLPVAAGLGGGSADAGAALRLLARANLMARDDARLMRAARRVGADVPVCVDPRPRRMRGIGERLSEPLAVPQLAAVLVNPGVALPTKDVFAALGLASGRPCKAAERVARLPRDADGFIEWLSGRSNDLESPAVKLRPEIARVLAALGHEPGCRLARMSGSGATCFGLFASSRAAGSAARRLASAHPRWWVKATVFG